MSTTANHPLNPDDGPEVRLKSRTLRKITPKEVFKREQYEMDYRFVREVERLEREGRVQNRLDLELKVGLSKGEVTAIRRGDRGVSLVNVKKLHELYRGDMYAIMFGEEHRKKEISAPYIPGIGRLDRFEPYIHRYTSTARWRCGRRAETSPAYYPPDPENELWEDPGPRNKRGAASGE